MQMRVLQIYKILIIIADLCNELMIKLNDKIERTYKLEINRECMDLNDTL